MPPKRLIVTFYLWFLLALTLTVASAGGAFALWSGQRWDEHLAKLALTNVRLVRDIAEFMLGMKDGRLEFRRLLEPVLEEDGISLVITGTSGDPLLIMRHSQSAPDDPVIPGAHELVIIEEKGQLVEWQNHGRFVVGLPIVLPSGDQGAFFVTGHRNHWRGGGPPYRLAAALGAILIVGWFLCWPLAAHLARPLKRLAATADELGSGNLSARINLNRRDEIGRLAASFNAMAASLQALVLGHKRLLADISHELRSPLARLRVALELARKESVPAGAAEGYLDRADRQADSLEALIDELLLFSRLDTAPDTLKLEFVPAADLIRDAKAAHEAEAESKGIRIESVEADGLPAVRADRRLMARALGNVLRNALAHAPRGSVIRMEVTAAEDHLRVAVSDEGPGVPDDMLERIFEPFFRADEARSRSTGGVGLGLAIVRRAMTAHGGSVRALSAPGGKGLIVVLCLPLHPHVGGVEAAPLLSSSKLR